MSLNPEQERALETREENRMEFKIGDKVVVYRVGEIEGITKNRDGSLDYNVKYRDEKGRYLGQSFVPAECLELDAVLHWVSA